MANKSEHAASVLQDAAALASGIAESLTQFRDAAGVLSSDHPRLIDEYPNQWIAVCRGRVEAHGGSLKSVIKKAEQKGCSRSDVIVRFIEKNHQTLIL